MLSQWALHKFKDLEKGAKLEAKFGGQYELG